MRTLNGKEEFHRGVDLVGIRQSDDEITEIISAVSGAVIQSRMVEDRSNLTWQWGNYVCVLGDDGRYYYYCHLDRRNVEKGDRVEAGQVIGYEGSSGYCTGRHLHFEVRREAWSGTDINPCKLLGIENTAGFTVKANGRICSDYAIDAIDFCIRSGIIVGDENGCYNIADMITRQDAMVMLYRLYMYIIKTEKIRTDGKEAG